MDTHLSRHYRDDRRETRGHGILGFTLTLILILGVFAGYSIFFTGDNMDGIKGKVYGFIYPQKYAALVEENAAAFSVDKDLIYAVIRTESGFRPEVESHAGAIGLMQLMPSTFDWLQEKLDGEVIYTVNRLTEPEINVRYGTYYLSVLLEKYDGSTATAAAAYNAGTSNVDGWLADSACSSDGRTLTKIPYKETESYVKKVEHAMDMYKKIYGTAQ